MPRKVVDPAGRPPCPICGRPQRRNGKSRSGAQLNKRELPVMGEKTATIFMGGAWLTV